MPESLCFSVYLSTFEKQKKMLEEHAGHGVPVFLSLHIKEEIDDTYCQKVKEICRWLCERQYRIIADISPVTLKQFNSCDGNVDSVSVKELAERLNIYAVRLDYGFSDEQIIEIGRNMPVVLNASTLDAEKGRAIKKSCKNVLAMHNFYPRPETGLDEDYFCSTTQKLQEIGIKVLAFIPGNMFLRGPIFERLPTLERHRNVPPSVAFAEFALLYNADGIFLGDGGISNYEYNINHTCKIVNLNFHAI